MNLRRGNWKRELHWIRRCIWFIRWVREVHWKLIILLRISASMLIKGLETDIVRLVRFKEIRWKLILWLYSNRSLLSLFFMKNKWTKIIYIKKEVCFFMIIIYYYEKLANLPVKSNPLISFSLGDCRVLDLSSKLFFVAEVGRVGSFNEDSAEFSPRWWCS